MFCDIGDVTAIAAAAGEHGMVILILAILILRIPTLIDVGPSFPWSVIRFAFFLASLTAGIDSMTRPVTILTFDVIVAMFLFHFRDVFSACALVLIVGLVSMGFASFAMSSTAAAAAAAILVLCEVGFVVDDSRHDRGFLLGILFLCSVAGFDHCV